MRSSIFFVPSVICFAGIFVYYYFKSAFALETESAVDGFEPPYKRSSISTQMLKILSSQQHQ